MIIIYEYYIGCKVNKYILSIHLFVVGGNYVSKFT